MADAPLHDLIGKTYVTSEELAHLESLVPLNGTFLEVGTAAGITAARIARMSAGRQVVCVDKFVDLGDPQVIADDGDRWTAWRLNVPPGVILWRGDLSSFRRFARPKAFDVIFIDADHLHPAVGFDLTDSLELVKEGGLITAHDFGNSFWTAPREAVLMFCDRYGWTVREQVGSLVVLAKRS
jgi:predicted O-methyltransferase YrrM